MAFGQPYTTDIVTAGSTVLGTVTAAGLGRDWLLEHIFINLVDIVGWVAHLAGLAANY